MESATKHSLKYVSKFDLPSHSPGLFIFIFTNKSQMLRMFNEANIFISTKASFFGDSDFPRSAIQYFKGGWIRFYEIIYKQYSRLAFTRTKDRSIAISGLEKRLIRFFNTHGGYSIFECFLHRDLLWQRGAHKEIEADNLPIGSRNTNLVLDGI